jgi:ribosome-binding factor A
MSNRTNLKLAASIQQRAAHVLIHELKDPRVGILTVTRVKLSPDLSSCVIYWSTLGGDGDRSKARHALESARLFVQRRVAEGLRTRTAPQLSFVYDESVAGSIKMGGLLKQLRSDRGDAPIDPAAPPTAEGADAGAEADEDEGDADEGDAAEGAAVEGDADEGEADDEVEEVEPDDADEEAEAPETDDADATDEAEVADEDDADEEDDDVDEDADEDEDEDDEDDEEEDDEARPDDDESDRDDDSGEERDDPSER